jgi:hypothetical protein
MKEWGKCKWKGKEGWSRKRRGRRKMRGRRKKGNEGEDSEWKGKKTCSRKEEVEWKEKEDSRQGGEPSSCAVPLSSVPLVALIARRNSVACNLPRSRVEFVAPSWRQFTDCVPPTCGIPTHVYRFSAL